MKIEKYYVLYYVNNKEETRPIYLAKNLEIFKENVAYYLANSFNRFELLWSQTDVMNNDEKELFILTKVNSDIIDDIKNLKNNFFSISKLFPVPA